LNVIAQYCQRSDRDEKLIEASPRLHLAPLPRHYHIYSVCDCLWPSEVRHFQKDSWNTSRVPFWYMCEDIPDKKYNISWGTSMGL